MKKLFYLLILFFFFSCNQNDSRAKYVLPVPVSYTIVSKSEVLNPKNIVFTIDSLNKVLKFSLSIKPLNINFPVNKQYADTLSKTVFTFEFYNAGKCIQSDYVEQQKTFRWKTDSLKQLDLKITSDTLDLKQGVSFAFDLPMYAFHHLKQGKQTIELKMYQNVFVGDKYVANENKTEKHFYFSENASLVYATLKFDIDVPAIYKTIIYGNGLELKNDSTFSPAGMDNTIWNSSYPDIYWTVSYPVGNYYCQTPYETSTDRYVAHDTFPLYHYHTNDSMAIGVFDHDNLSRDDFMGYRVFTFYSKQKTAHRRASFDAIKWFDFAMKHEGIANQ